MLGLEGPSQRVVARTGLLSALRALNITFMRILLLGAALTFGFAVSAAGCNNECGFFERCDGDVLEICGDGPDQIVNRKLHRHPCEAPNATCRERTDDIAECVYVDAIACDDTTASRCEGSLLLECPRRRFSSESKVEEARFMKATDCTELDDDSLPGYTPDAVGTCVATSDGADCAYE